MIEKKRGQKLCEKCNTPNGVRAYECKNCDYPFKMKKYRKGSKKKRVDDFTTLQKGDEIRVVGGSGPYYTNEDGEKIYLTDRGKYIVKKVDDTGIHTHGKHGHDYLYMGKKCPSPILDSKRDRVCTTYCRLSPVITEAVWERVVFGAMLTEF